MGKQRSKRYVDPMSPLGQDNLPIVLSKGRINLNVKLPEQTYIGDTGSSDYIGDQYQYTDYDDLNTYKEDLPYLEDIRESNQGSLSALGNSLGKFVGKTAINVIGGLGGTVYGGVNAIAQGDYSKLWDNSFMDKLDILDKGVDNIFKVYKSLDYEDQNILQRAFLHPVQFTDDAMGALSFTVGAILTELLTSGLGSATVLPKALKYMKYLDRSVDAAEATANLSSKAAIAMNAIGPATKLTKQLATGAAYESMVEARQASMELRDKLTSEWESLNPDISMPDSVSAEIDDKVSKAGLFTYLSNLALVGSSNIVQFPKIFGLGSKTIRDVEGKIIKNAESELFESTISNPSRLTKVAAGLKNPLYEGIIEEGGQHTVSDFAKNYWSLKNDQQSKDEVGDFLGVFADSLAKTYTTKEGWNDIGMGMLIGSLGAPGRGILSALGKDNSLGKYGFEELRDDKGEITGYKRRELWGGGIMGGINELNQDINSIENLVSELNQIPSLSSAMKANHDFLVQNNLLQKKADDSWSNNDLFEFNNAKDDQIHAYVSSRVKAGLYDDLVETVDKMKQMTPEEFYIEFKGEEANNNTTDIQRILYKKSTIDEFQKKAENTREAFEITDRIYKGNNEDLREELIHSIAATKNMDVRETSINNRLKEITKNTIDLNQVKGIGDPQVEKDLIDLYKQFDPIQYNLYKDEIQELVKDSKRVKDQRQKYLNMYNILFTEEGQKAFEEYQTKLAEDAIKLEEETRKKEEEAAREKEKKVNIENIKKKVETQEVPPPTIEDELIPIPEATLEPIEDTVEEAEEVLDTEETAVMAIESNKEVKANRELAISDDGLVKNASSEEQIRIGDLEIHNLDYKRIIGNTISYLGIDKVTLGRLSDGEIESKSFDIYDDEGNIIINEFVDVKLFSRNDFIPGDRVNMFVPTFEQMQERGLQDYTSIDYNNNIEDVNEFPIAIVDDTNKIVGYVPTQSGVKRLVSDEFKEVALQQNLLLRTKIFENKEETFSTTITSKSPGWLILNKPSNQKSLYTALGDGTKLANDVTIGIGKLDQIYINNSRGGVYKNSIINGDKVVNGVVYAIVPSSKEDSYIMYPMDTKPIGESNAATIVNAIRIFAKTTSNKALTSSEKQSFDNLSEDYNFNNFDDLTKFINTVMYGTANPAKDEYIFKLYKDNLILDKYGKAKFPIQRIIDDEATRKAIIDILSKRFYSVRLENLNSNSPYIQYILDNGIIIPKEYNNYKDYLNDNQVITSNIRGIKIENNEYAFTAQSVIGISNEVVPVAIRVEEVAEPIVEEIIEETPKKKPKKGLGLDPNKFKGKKPNLDINPESIVKASITSAEDLMKKCL